MPADIAAVVPTHRRGDRLRRLVDALARQTLDPARWELIVVDDRSDDPRVDEVLAALPGLVPCAATALRTSRNRGPAVARNLGWHHTDAPIVAFVDDDVVPEPGWLEAGLRAFDDPAVGVVQGHTDLPGGQDSEELPFGCSWRIVDAAGAHYEACNIFYRRAALEATTGFDEELRWWGEDTTVGWQVVENGWRRAFAADARAAHDVERKPVRWWLRNGWLEHHLVLLAARHPGFREEAFWRPWAYRRRDAAFLLAAASLVAALRWRVALVGALPYLWYGRPLPHHRRPADLLELGLIDAVRAAGHLAGAVRHRILVI